ncbi:MAG: PAS domain-containing sensor histidine kinase [Cytophagales bacterium]|nr:PAS domain-containing sensor histidine kinase [Cytophagales bacterium]
MIQRQDFTETNDFLLSLIGSAPYGIIAIDLEGFVTIANTQAIECLGLKTSVQELVDMEILEVVQGMEELTNEIRKCLTKGRNDFDLEEVSYLDKYLTFRGRKILGGMVITIADITSVKLSEQEILHSLLQGQEQERRRLAQEIHDGIGPSLSTIKLNLANIESDLQQIDPSRLENFRASYQMIDEVANDLRSISHNLLPKVLLDFGLLEALDTLIERIRERKTIAIEFLNPAKDLNLSKTTELGLYRIIQELINNTLKYAEATKITLQLVKHESTVLLTYEDDGKGFDPHVARKGIGLFNIHNRTLALGGEDEIHSQPGRGMSATIEVPIA